MKFRTEISIQKPSFFLNHQHKILSIGSCFADTIAEKLKHNKFQLLKNPFGNLFHPLAIAKIIKFGIDIQQKDYENAFIEKNHTWLNYYFHSDIWDITKNNLQKKIEEKISILHQFIQKIDILMLTFGTAFIYEKNDNQQIVSNCHQQNPNIFTKKLLAIETIINDFETIYQSLKIINPSIKIILTVSPVRHSKEDLANDHLSKSILRVATHILAEKYKDNIYYFPAFEILNDDLRDYRFYKEDLIHPTLQAENYVWQKFSSIFFEASTQKIINDWNKIYHHLQHQPKNKNNPDYILLLEKTKKDLTAISQYIDVKNEMEFFL